MALAILRSGSFDRQRPTADDWSAKTPAVTYASVEPSQTTVAIQQYLEELAQLRGDSPAEPVIRALLSRAVNRLHLLCANLLHRSYPRLTRGPVNLNSEEMLGAVVERLLKALREIRPQTVRQFFALASRHMRWELNEVARKLDATAKMFSLQEGNLSAPAELESVAGGGPNLGRIILAIETLPEDENEVFNLVQIQGMTHAEAAQLIGCSTKTVQRRLNHGLMLLTQALEDLVPAANGNVSK